MKLEKIEQVKNVLGLNGYEVRVYSVLCASDNPMKARKVAEISGVPHARVYDVLLSLEKKGLVKTKIYMPEIEKFEEIDFKTFKKIKDFGLRYGLRISFMSPSSIKHRNGYKTDETGRTLQHSKCYVALPISRYVKRSVAQLKKNIKLIEKLV
jgi:hypothetical protein